jgi:hypothetical protein
VPDLRDFQSLFSCHRSTCPPQVALPDLPFLWALTQAHLTYEVSLCSLRLSRNHHLIQCHTSEIDPGIFIQRQRELRPAPRTGPTCVRDPKARLEKTLTPRPQLEATIFDDWVSGQTPPCGSDTVRLV